MEQKKAILHCSDSEFGCALLINNWHRERGFYNVEYGISIGYHFVILNGKPWKKEVYHESLDGSVEAGRPITEIGAHCKGMNGYLGICLIGKNSFTDRQFIALSDLLHSLGIKKENIYGHNDFDKNKTCPNFSVALFKKDYMGGK